MKLSKESQKIWTELTDKKFKTTGQKEFLRVGLQARDRATEAGEILKKEGMITKTGRSQMQHAHPAIKIEKEAWATVLKVFRALNLQYDSTEIDAIIDGMNKGAGN